MRASRFVNELLHTTWRGIDFHGHRPGVCMQRPTSSMGFHERVVRHLNPTFGSSYSAGSAYQMSLEIAFISTVQ
ncbi:hypothetical protein ANCDUO_05240 [Ancylostoma duodenale]|uniref:Uncharacterized protein n=1 Tax=Ancylostoma duodenale TaxID=51022 RepID=A0A0C2GT62_9BILA|nr:hypothetical protein ANCDUO_05240 [Ancylostoma duodenale]